MDSSSSSLKRGHRSWSSHVPENLKLLPSPDRSLHPPWKRWKPDPDLHDCDIRGSSPVLKSHGEIRSIPKKDRFAGNGEQRGKFLSTGTIDRSNRGDLGRHGLEKGKLQVFHTKSSKLGLKIVDYKPKTDNEKQEQEVQNSEQDLWKGSSAPGFRDDQLKCGRPSTAICHSMEDDADISLCKLRKLGSGDRFSGQSRFSSPRDSFKRIIKLKTKHSLAVELPQARKESISRVKVKEVSSSTSKNSKKCSDEPSPSAVVRSCRAEKPSAELMPLEVPFVFPHIPRRARSERRRDNCHRGKKGVSLDGFDTELEEALLKIEETDVESQFAEEIQKGVVDMESCTPSYDIAQETLITMQKVMSTNEAEEREEGEFDPEFEVDGRRSPEKRRSHVGNSEGPRLDKETTGQGLEDLKFRKHCEQESNCERQLVESSSHNTVLCAIPVEMHGDNKGLESDGSKNGNGCMDDLACTEVQFEQSRLTTLACAADDRKAGFESGQGQNICTVSSIDGMNEEKPKINIDKVVSDCGGPNHMNLCAVDMNLRNRDSTNSSSDPRQTSTMLQATVDEFSERNKASFPAEPTGQNRITHENVEPHHDLNISFSASDEQLGESDKATGVRDHCDSDALQEELDDFSICGRQQKRLKVDFLDLSLALPGFPLLAGKPIPKPSDNEASQVVRATRLLSHLQTETMSNGFTRCLSTSSFVHSPLCSPHSASLENQNLSCGVTRNINQGPWIDSGGNGHCDANTSGTRMECKPDSPEHNEASQDSKLPGSGTGLPLHAVASPYSGSNLAAETRYEIASGQAEIAVRDRVNIVPSVVPSFDQRSISERSKGREVTRLPNIEIGLLEVSSEPVAAMAQRLQELPDSFLEGLKGLVQNLLGNFAKREEFLSLQRILRERSDLTEQTLLRAHPVQLEIFVALKTGMQSFVRQGAKSLTYKALIEIFLQTRCRNVDCQQLLPVDDCECEICSEKKGFCHACMCVVCSKFDSDSNTSRWVGCDVCMHWCHTDCGLRMSQIKSTLVSRNGSEFSEMQFKCLSCDHYMELYGFVKGVFENFAGTWGAETLAKELDCVRRIFHASDDVKGKRLRWKAEEMLQMLERNSSVRDVCESMVQFFSDDGAKRTLSEKGSPFSSLKMPSGELRGTIEGMDKAFATMNSLVARKLNNLLEEKENGGKQMEGAESVKSKDGIGGSQDLHSIIGAKLTDVLMYQARADAAREDAVNLQRMISLKKRNLEEDCYLRSAKLKLDLMEEQQRKHLKELQALERSHHEYEFMKSRIETDMKLLMMKIMEMRSQHLV